jgi:hypothetical protein
MKTLIALVGLLIGSMLAGHAEERAIAPPGWAVR